MTVLSSVVHQPQSRSGVRQRRAGGGQVGVSGGRGASAADR